MLKTPLKSILGLDISQDGYFFGALNLTSVNNRILNPQENESHLSAAELDERSTTIAGAFVWFFSAGAVDKAAVNVALKDVPTLGKNQKVNGVQEKDQTILAYKVITRTPSTTTVSVYARGVAIGSPNSAFVPSGPIGAAVKITNPGITKQTVAEYYQSVGIDPQGRFILYTKFSPACQKNLLIYQRIDPALPAGPGALAPNIRKVGGPKTLAGCTDFTDSSTGAYGLDVINLD